MSIVIHLVMIASAVSSDNMRDSIICYIVTIRKKSTDQNKWHIFTRDLLIHAEQLGVTGLISSLLCNEYEILFEGTASEVQSFF